MQGPYWAVPKGGGTGAEALPSHKEWGSTSAGPQTQGLPNAVASPLGAAPTLPRSLPAQRAMNYRETMRLHSAHGLALAFYNQALSFGLL